MDSIMIHAGKKIEQLEAMNESQKKSLKMLDEWIQKMDVKNIELQKKISELEHALSFRMSDIAVLTERLAKYEKQN